MFGVWRLVLTSIRFETRVSIFTSFRMPFLGLILVISSIGMSAEPEEISTARLELNAQYKQCLIRTKLRYSDLEKAKIEYLRNSILDYLVGAHRARPMEHEAAMKRAYDAYISDTNEVHLFDVYRAAFSEEALKSEIANSIGLQNVFYRRFARLIQNGIFEQEPIASEELLKVRADLVKALKKHHMKKHYADLQAQLAAEGPAVVQLNEENEHLFLRVVVLVNSLSEQINGNYLASLTIAEQDQRVARARLAQVGLGVFGIGVMLFAGAELGPLVLMAGKGGSLIGLSAASSAYASAGAAAGKLITASLADVLWKAHVRASGLGTPYGCELLFTIGEQDLLSKAGPAAGTGAVVGAVFPSLARLNVAGKVLLALTGAAVVTTTGFTFYSAARDIKIIEMYEQLLADLINLKDVPPLLKQEHQAWIARVREEIMAHRHKLGVDVTESGTNMVDFNSVIGKKELVRAMKGGIERVTRFAATNGDKLPNVIETNGSAAEEVGEGIGLVARKKSPAVEGAQAFLEKLSGELRKGSGGQSRTRVTSVELLKSSYHFKALNTDWRFALQK